MSPSPVARGSQVSGESLCPEGAPEAGGDELRPAQGHGDKTGNQACGCRAHFHSQGCKVLLLFVVKRDSCSGFPQRPVSRGWSWSAEGGRTGWRDVIWVRGQQTLGSRPTDPQVQGPTGFPSGRGHNSPSSFPACLGPGTHCLMTGDPNSLGERVGLQVPLSRAALATCQSRILGFLTAGMDRSPWGCSGFGAQETNRRVVNCHPT